MSIERQSGAENTEFSVGSNEYGQLASENIATQENAQALSGKEQDAEQQGRLDEAEPKEWPTVREVAAELGKSTTWVHNRISEYRALNPESVVILPSERGSRKAHYSPEAVSILRRLGSRDERRRPTSDVENAKEGELTLKEATKIFKTSPGKIRAKLGGEFNNLYGWRKSQEGKMKKMLSQEAVQKLSEAFAEAEDAATGMVTPHALALRYGAVKETILNSVEEYLKENPDQIVRARDSKGRITDFLKPEAVKLVDEAFKERPDKLQEGEVTLSALLKKMRDEYNVPPSIARQYLGFQKEVAPEQFQERRLYGKATTVVSADLAELAYEQFKGGFPRANPEELPAYRLAQQLGVRNRQITRAAEEALKDRPDLVELKVNKKNQLLPHYSPEAQDLIRKQLEIEGIEKRGEYAAKELQEKFINNMSELEKGELQWTQEFNLLIDLFGGERAIDILYMQHPEYSKLPLPFVKSVIPEYLGDFMVTRGALNIDSLEAASGYLSSSGLKEGLVEVVKNDCLRFYNSVKRNEAELSDREIINSYINHIRERSDSYTNEHLQEVLDTVQEFYRSAVEDFNRPSNVIDRLRPEREFPDLNQLINIKEIRENGKMLIADEMGLGKSASVIFAKESLGVNTALLVVPSNVAATWEGYLSDNRDSEIGQAGYFKEGEAPNVLVVKSLEDLDLAIKNEHDYILLSHERLRDDYVKALKEVNFDMLIVDEAHKLKNITQGIRADNLLTLSEKIQGEDKYLALLSGTPVPNKVEDVAMVLKMLYPENETIKNHSSQQLVSALLKGDILDIRRLLVPRMEIKELRESIGMPRLNEEVIIPIQVSEGLRNVLEVIADEDEMTATEKIQANRQAVMNPELIDATPELEVDKIMAVASHLQKDFSEKDKIVMFVNGYVEGVIKGEKSIIDKLNLPPDVSLKIIHGKTTPEERSEIQSELKHSSGKMLLIVSGQTADVGVDFSAGQMVYFYNEPWSVYDKLQQLGRVYRPGIQDELTYKTFIALDTIEEGIHKYSAEKYKAIDKLIRGIPLSELESSIAVFDERRNTPNLEVNSELAESLMSDLRRATQLFAYNRNTGEEKFREFAREHGSEYARIYRVLGGRSYQANAARLTGNLINKFADEKNQTMDQIKILDIASGPEVLSEHAPEIYKDNIYSVDYLKEHFEGRGGNVVAGSFLNLPFSDKSLDYANLSMAIHYTNFAPSRGAYERLEVFKEINRILKQGGRAIVTTVHSWDFRDKGAFREAVEKMGFSLVDEFTGNAVAGDGFKAGVITLEKVADCPDRVTDLIALLGPLMKTAFKDRKIKSSLRNSRNVLTEYKLNGRDINIQLNPKDQEIYREEGHYMSAIMDLINSFGSVESIPRSEVVERGFGRFRVNKRTNKYSIYKKLQTAPGFVVMD